MGASGFRHGQAGGLTNTMIEFDSNGQAFWKVRQNNAPPIAPLPSLGRQCQGAQRCPSGASARCVLDGAERRQLPPLAARSSRARICSTPRPTAARSPTAACAPRTRQRPSLPWTRTARRSSSTTSSTCRPLWLPVRLPPPSFPSHQPSFPSIYASRNLILLRSTSPSQPTPHSSPPSLSPHPIPRSCNRLALRRGVPRPRLVRSL